MSKISEFIAAALADTENNHSEISFGYMPNFQAQSISSATGLALKNVKKILTAHAVRHAFVRHDNKKSESDRGQVGICEADFEHLPKILPQPDEVIKGDLMNRKKNDVLKFSKLIDGKTYNVLVSINRSKFERELVFNTMFIKK